MTASAGRSAIKFKEDLCPELKAKLERRPLATQEAPAPPVSAKAPAPQVPVPRRPAEVRLGGPLARACHDLYTAFHGSMAGSTLAKELLVF